MQYLCIHISLLHLPFNSLVAAPGEQEKDCRLCPLTLTLKMHYEGDLLTASMNMRDDDNKQNLF